MLGRSDGRGRRGAFTGHGLHNRWRVAPTTFVVGVRQHKRSAYGAHPISFPTNTPIGLILPEIALDKHRASLFPLFHKKASALLPRGTIPRHGHDQA